MAIAASNTTQENRLLALIAGVARSGTTLLASIINRHSEICVTPETHYFRTILDTIPGGFQAIRSNWPDSLSKVLDQIHATEGWEAAPERVLAHLQTQPPTAGELFTAIGNSIADAAGKRLWIEKTPPHIRFYKQIRALYPDLPIINIIRDGRDAALSMSKTTWASDSVCESLFRWKIELDRFQQESHGDPNVKTIRYESLVQEPEQTIKDLCDFLGIAFEPTMLIPDGSESMLIERDTKHKALIHKRPDISRTFNWKQSMDAALASTCTAIAAPTLDRNHYEAVAPDPKALTITINAKPPYRDYPQTLDEALIALSRAHEIKVVANSEIAKLLFSRNDYLIWGGVHELEKHNIKIFEVFRNLAVTAIGALWLKLSGTRLIWFYHGDIAWSKKWRYRRVMERLLAWAASYVIYGKHDARTISTHLRISGSKLYAEITDVPGVTDT